MFDDLDHLRDNSGLLQLLGHYVELAEPDREAWQDRLMHLEGLEPRDLTKLHGQLIGFGWLEQNTGHTPVLRADAVPACYRATLAGIRAFRDVHGLPRETETVQTPTPYPQRKKNSRKKRTQADKAAATA